MVCHLLPFVKVGQYSGTNFHTRKTKEKLSTFENVSHFVVDMVTEMLQYNTFLDKGYGWFLLSTNIKFSNAVRFDL